MTYATHIPTASGHHDFVRPCLRSIAYIGGGAAILENRVVRGSAQRPSNARDIVYAIFSAAERQPSIYYLDESQYHSQHSLS